MVKIKTLLKCERRVCFAGYQNNEKSKLLEFTQQPELLVLKTFDVAWKYKQISHSGSIERAFQKESICLTFFR